MINYYNCLRAVLLHCYQQLDKHKIAGRRASLRHFLSGDSLLHRESDFKKLGNIIEHV